VFLDKLDIEILNHLKKDARKPFVKIAAELGVSEGTVRGRVHRLEKTGIIKTYTIITQEENLVQALVSVKIEANSDIKKIAHKIAGISDSNFTFEIMGDFDIVTLINAHSTAELDDKIEMIRKLAGVTTTSSALVLKRYY